MNTDKAIQIERQTKETQIDIQLKIRGSQQLKINTGLAFFDHMLSQLALHAGWDLRLKASGDLEVDDHHLIEDVAICLGRAFNQAWRQQSNIKRFGQRLLPMDASLVMVAVDVAGRSYCVCDLPFDREMLGGIATEMWKHFFYSFAINAHISLHIKTEYFDNNHHLIEACFKGLAFALSEALESNNKENSSKGVL
ncbi:imidazoleglycerol-phosphate dehydratase HisB [Kangiella sp. TOML190]|uniref:imidazoleglycerol-phosphate dehydratase HisB n=1 Tax=Kangiella sp. TOML190 TaxID=2931351 RepID=UPI00203B0E14|nr:imidazoleglycerol-phosphate dehydratase HisB [Kangiella sp. TOML190]